MAGKNVGRKGSPKHPDGSPRLPGFFDDHGPSGVRLLPGQKSEAEVKKMMAQYGKRK